MDKLLSIVILTYNEFEYTSDCLKSLGDVITRDDVETIVIDNGSAGEDARTLKQLFPSITVIRNDVNLGVARARNIGLTKAVGDFVLILDNDTIATPEAIDALIAHMRENDDVGICGCVLRNADGLFHNCRQYPGLLLKAKNALHIGRERLELPIHGHEYLEAGKDFDYLIGACQMVRRSALEQVGLLDDSIFYGPEDADFCIRMRSAGYKVRGITSACITHFWQRATRRKRLSRLTCHHVKALMHFYIKHRRIL